MTTPRLGAPELTEGQAVPETTVNEQIRYMEAGSTKFIFIDRDLATPPGSPADGDCYLVAASPTGAWSGQAGKIAFRVNTAWAFITPLEGFTAWVNDENAYIGYDGAAWNTIAATPGAYLPLTGGTLSGDLIVPDEAYDATAWNGSLEVPTKNAIRDKIETLGGGYAPGGTDVALADGGTGASLTDPNADRILFWDDSAGAMTWLTAGTGLSITGTTLSATSTAPTECIILAPSDETTALTTGTAKITFRMPYAFTVTGVRCSLTTAQTSGSIFTVDINEAGTTILSTKLTIDNTEKTSTTAVTAAVISDTALADDAEITVDIDQVGDGTAKGLKVVLIGHQ